MNRGINANGRSQCGNERKRSCLSEYQDSRSGDERRGKPFARPADSKAALDRIAEVRNRDGKEDLYRLRHELRAIIDRDYGVFRTGADMARGLAEIRAIRQRALMAPVRDKSEVYNSNLFHALELQNMIDLAEVVAVGGLAREESRGAHARRDFTKRDDEKWLKHTLIFHTGGEPRAESKPVTITAWKPIERKY